MSSAFTHYVKMILMQDSRQQPTPIVTNKTNENRKAEEEKNAYFHMQGNDHHKTRLFCYQHSHE